MNEEKHDEEQKPKEVENAQKPRDWYTRIQPNDELSDSSGSRQSGEKFGGRFMGGGRGRA